MEKLTDVEYSKRFKAKVALEATNNEAIASVAKKYSIPESKVKLWTKQLRERANLLFSGPHAANQTEVIHNHAALLRNTLEASTNGILVTDLNQRLITYNQKCVEIWNVPLDMVERGEMKEIIRYVLTQINGAEGFQRRTKQGYINPEKEFCDVVELKDGRYLQRHSVPYRTDGQIVGRVINFVDITQYKKNEEKLRRFGNLLQSINANVNDGILRSTPDKGLVYVNDAFVEIFGYNSKEEVLATHPAEFYAEKSDRLKLIEQLKVEGGYNNYEVLFKRKDGSTFWGLENSTLTHSNENTYIDGVITDVDSWKKAEQALRKSEEKYRRILRNIEEGYFETDLAGNFTFFNSALVDMIGYPSQEVIGMNNRKYMSEETAKIVYDTFNEVYKTGNPERGFDWELICGDGSRIFVEASVTLRVDRDGTPTGFSGMVRDVTERKQKQKQIQESLKEKEVLLGEIHHRVKNNLAVISGLLYLQADKTNDAKAFQALRESQNRINSMALIHELLYDNRTFSSLNPRTYIEQLVAHISSNMKSGETMVETRIEAENFDLEMSTAIPCALIINELITNAFKYAFEDRNEGLIEIIFQKEDDGRYHLEVVDDGQGLPPGFDINDSSQHSLGLSLVKTLSRQLHGELEVHNGDGTRFVLEFEG